MNMSKNKQSVLRSIANSGGAATVRGGQAQVGADSLVKDGLLRQTGAQGYAIGGRSVSRADYEQLVTRERELAARLPEDHPAKARAGGIRVRFGVPA